MRIHFIAALVLLAAIAPSIFGGSIPGITATTIPSPPSFADLTVGPDGNIWFTAWKENSIGRITPGPNFTLFSLPVANSVPLSIALGVDGNLWFTEQAGRVGRITTTGAIKEFPVAAGDFLEPIVAAADGTLWFLDRPKQTGPTPPNANLGRITTDGQLTSYGLGSNDSLEAMIAGPDGKLWLYDFTKNAVLKVSTIDGTIAATISMPVAAGNNHQNHFVLGPDGNLWMTHGDSSIARIKMDGTITEYSIPTAGGTPTGLNVGGDGNLWFTEYNGKVGQLILSSATDSGQATINESDPILGTSAITLVSLPGTVPSSASSPVSAQGTVHVQDDNPCVEQTNIVTHTENDTLVQVKVTVPPQKLCADIGVKGLLELKDLGQRSQVAVKKLVMACAIGNNGPSNATNVYTNCNAVGGDIIASTIKQEGTGECTVTPTAFGLTIKAPVLFAHEVCVVRADYAESSDGLNVLTMAGGADQFDPKMGNNTDVTALQITNGEVKIPNPSDVHVIPVIDRGH